MAQERTINDLLVLALYQINAFAVGENIDAFAQQTGLEIINLLLDSFSESQIFIPFNTSIDFTMEPGKDTYIVSNVVLSPDIQANLISKVIFATFTMGDGDELKYPIRIVDEASYFNNLRISTLEAPPSWVFLENFDFYSQLTFYPKPGIAYPVNLQVKSFLNHVELFTNIAGLPRAFHDFFRLHLARQYIDFYPSAEWTPKMQEDYDKLEKRIMAQQINMTIEPSIVLNRSAPWIYPTILSMP